MSHKLFVAVVVLGSAEMMILLWDPAAGHPLALQMLTWLCGGVAGWVLCRYCRTVSK